MTIENKPVITTPAQARSANRKAFFNPFTGMGLKLRAVDPMELWREGCLVTDPGMMELDTESLYPDWDEPRRIRTEALEAYCLVHGVVSGANDEPFRIVFGETDSDEELSLKDMTPSDKRYFAKQIYLLSGIVREESREDTADRDNFRGEAKQDTPGGSGAVGAGDLADGEVPAQDAS